MPGTVVGLKGMQSNKLVDDFIHHTVHITNKGGESQKIIIANVYWECNLCRAHV